MQDLQQRPSGQLRVLVGLQRTSPTHPAAEFRQTGVADGFGGDPPTGSCSASGREPPAASSRRKCDLPAGAVGARDGHPLAEPGRPPGRSKGHQDVAGRAEIPAFAGMTQRMGSG